MPDRLFEDLYRDTEGLRWATASQVQERGRRLARRRTVTVLAGVFGLVVVGAGAVNALAGPGPLPDRPDVVATAPRSPSPTDPTPPTTPSVPPATAANPSTPSSPAGRPSSPTVPLAAMLQAADLPSGYRAFVPEMEGDWPVHSLSTVCDNQWTSGGAIPNGDRKRFFQSGQKRVEQAVSRYPGTSSTRYVPTLRANLQGCRSFEVTVADQGFAGDESMLVLTGAGDGWIIVRQGDLVSEVTIDKGADRAEVRRLAERVADRLCAGTDRC